MTTNPTINGLTVPRNFHEAMDLLDRFVDPDERWLGPDGEKWLPIGVGKGRMDGEFSYVTQQDLDKLRGVGRQLAHSNGFAICGHENRISYIVGTGHTYEFGAKTGLEVSEQLIEQVTRWFEDEWSKAVDWAWMQEHNQLRADRDGEVFLRIFDRDEDLGAEDEMLVRFIDPEDVRTPEKMNGLQSAPTFGIVTGRDIQRPLGYWIADELIEASEIQHRKFNCDANQKRGVPLFYPVRDELRAAKSINRAVAAMVALQAAIAIVRKHANANETQTRGMLNRLASYTTVDQVTGVTNYYQHFKPGTILDVPASQEYEFPSINADASKGITAVQSNLRAAAARVVMPEYMFTADASNANFSSTLVAEAPAVRNFGRVQQRMIWWDRQIIQRAMVFAIKKGKLDAAALEQIQVDPCSPTIISRDPLAEAQTNQVLYMSGILSPQTWSQRADLDYGAEQTNIQEHIQNVGGTVGSPIEPEGDDLGDDDGDGGDNRDAA